MSIAADQLLLIYTSNVMSIYNTTETFLFCLSMMWQSMMYDYDCRNHAGWLMTFHISSNVFVLLSFLFLYSGLRIEGERLGVYGVFVQNHV